MWWWARREYRNQCLCWMTRDWHSVQTQTATITHTGSPNFQVPFKRFLYVSLKLFSDIQCVAKVQGPSFFEELHLLFWGQYSRNSQNRTCRTIHFLCKNLKKSLEGKTANIWRCASTSPCSCYLFLSPMHCTVYCWYKDDNFTGCIIRHIAAVYCAVYVRKLKQKS